MMFPSQEQIDEATARLMNLYYDKRHIEQARTWVIEHPEDYPDPDKLYEYLLGVLEATEEFYDNE